jgi:hypothetical protein
LFTCIFYGDFKMTIKSATGKRRDTSNEAKEREEAAKRELDVLDQQRAIVKTELDRERLLRVTGSVIETITSPTFVEKMRQARRAADAGAGMDVAAELLSIEGLRAAGADIPPDFRLTSRVFEDREEGIRAEIKSSETPGPNDVAPRWGGCAGAGGLTFCGCGGFQV